MDWHKRDVALSKLRLYGLALGPAFVFAVLAMAASSTSYTPRATLVQATRPVAHVAEPVHRVAVVPRAAPHKVATAAALKAPSAFEIESRMSNADLMRRWYPKITKAAQRFGVPVVWIRTVMTLESGGRTMSGENAPVTSRAGAMGLMQLMPETYREMRAQYGLGPDPYDPDDNIIAAAAYLRFLRGKYGYPAMFAAYNDGPGNLEQRMLDGQMLPVETQLYVGRITGTIPFAVHGGPRSLAKFTRPNGALVLIDAVTAVAVRAPLPGEYAPGVRAVIKTGRIQQGVRESVAAAKASLRAHGGAV